MTTMDQNTIETLASEIGFNDENLVIDTFEAEKAGTAIDNPIRSTNSIVIELFKKNINSPYTSFLSAFKKLIPQFYARYATGTWLIEHAKDVGLEQAKGRKAKYELTINKDIGTELNIPKDTIFLTGGLDPRKYQTLQEYSFSAGVGSGTEDIIIEVESLEIGVKFNVQAGLINQTQSVLDVNTITNLSSEPLVSGKDLESEDSLRTRILNVKQSNIDLGIEDYYLTRLQSLEYVENATLDNVNDVDATLYFTIYGATGLSQEDADNATIALKAEKMATDKLVVNYAQPENLSLTIDAQGIFNAIDIQNAVTQFFVKIEKGTDFYGTNLADYLYDQFADLKNLICTPQYQSLPTGRYWLATTTVNDAN
jgi:hypothetical protein